MEEETEQAAASITKNTWILHSQHAEEPDLEEVLEVGRKVWLFEKVMGTRAFHHEDPERPVAAEVLYKDGTRAFWVYDVHQRLVRVGPLFAVAVLVLNPTGTLAMVASVKREGKLGLPAGKVETKETPLQAVVRETREETGLKVERAVFLGGRNDPNGSKVALFLATHWMGTLGSSEEGEAKWVRLESVKGNLAYPEWMGWAMALLYRLSDLKPALEHELSQFAVDMVRAWLMVSAHRVEPPRRLAPGEFERLGLRKMVVTRAAEKVNEDDEDLGIPEVWEDPMKKWLSSPEIDPYLGQCVVVHPERGILAHGPSTGDILRTIGLIPDGAQIRYLRSKGT